MEQGSVKSPLCGAGTTICFALTVCKETESSGCSKVTWRQDSWGSSPGFAAEL